VTRGSRRAQCAARARAVCGKSARCEGRGGGAVHGQCTAQRHLPVEVFCY
jgi:hypothetical protein